MKKQKKIAGSLPGVNILARVIEVKADKVMSLVESRIFALQQKAKTGWKDFPQKEYQEFIKQQEMIEKNKPVGNSIIISN